jgi:hypothetical protein
MKPFSPPPEKKRVKGQRESCWIQEKIQGLMGWPRGFPSQVLKAEQSNTSILYGDRFYLKLFRNLREVNPDGEITQFLTEKASFQSIPLRRNDRVSTAGVEPILIGCSRDLFSVKGCLEIHAGCPGKVF